MAAIKRAGSRLAKWFKTFRDRNRPPYRWHESTHYGE